MSQIYRTKVQIRFTIYIFLGDVNMNDNPELKSKPTGLDSIFAPDNVAVIGASDVKDSVGYRLMKNFMESGFAGKVFPVNMKKPDILGIKAYKKIGDVPEKIDLAVISTPAKTVPGIVEECGKAGITGIVIISAGFKEIGKEGKALETETYAHKKKYGLKIIGPNCLGVINPSDSVRLNASFSARMPAFGNISFINSYF